MYCFVTLTLLALALTISGVQAGCTSDVDCKNNFDCVKLGFFLGSFCVPKSCAEGAVQAMIAEGFDPQKWVDDITAKTGLGGGGFWGRRSEEDNAILQRAYETATPPPMDAFTRYYEACTNPKTDADRDKILSSSLVYHGLQWSIGAGFLYTGKSLWQPFHNSDSTYQVIQHCVGFLLGAQLGAASYLATILTFNIDLDDLEVSANRHPYSPTRQATPELETYCVPIAVVGPLQVNICFDPEGDLELFNIVEVSIGGQLGVGFGGFQACFFENLFPFDLDSFPTPSPTARSEFDFDMFEFFCATSTTLQIGDSVTESIVGRRTFVSRDCGDAVKITFSRGYFYQVIGDGKTITVDTCSSMTDFDTQISVWSGTCTSLTCVAGNDDQGNSTCSSGSGLEARVSWASTSGTDYFVYVHNRNRFNFNTKTFKMTVTSA